MVSTNIFSFFMGHALLQQLVAHMDQKQALAEVKGWILWPGGAIEWPSLPGKLWGLALWYTEWRKLWQ